MACCAYDLIHAQAPDQGDGGDAQASESADAGQSSDGDAGSADTNDNGDKWRILPTGRHHDRASYRAGWYFFTGKRSAIAAKLGTPARHIDGNCRTYIEGEEESCYDGPMPASDGWVFAEGVRQAVALVISNRDSDAAVYDAGPAAPAAKRRKKGAADAEKPQTWCVYTELLHGECSDSEGEGEGEGSDEEFSGGGGGGGEHEVVVPAEAARRLDHWLHRKLGSSVTWEYDES